MTVQQKDQLKERIKSGFSIANFVILLTFIWTQAQWQESVEQHIQNEEIHRTYKEKTKLFVPRNELQIQLENINKMLLEIKTDIKNLEEKK